MKLEHATRLAQQFEACTLPKEEWTHTAHFIMAFWYCMQLPLPQAVEKIRNGIRAYNVSVGGVNTDTSGYHETITLFYITRIADYLITAGVTALTDTTLAEFLRQPFLDRAYICQFYEKEKLMSPAARRKWMPYSVTTARTSCHSSISQDEPVADGVQKVSALRLSFQLISPAFPVVIHSAELFH